jgi:ankyrin repeat protein
MRLLLDHGAQINQRCPSYDEYDGTPLMNAWYSGNTDAVLFLLERGADPNFPNDGGATILSAVARNNDEELVKLLLERGVQVDPKDHFGATPLAYAVRKGFLGITEKLIKAGADVNMQNHHGESVLMMACASAESNEEIIHELLHHGANPNIQDSSLESPLSISTRHGSLGVVRLLFDKGADPNIPGKRGETALFRAAEEGHGDLISTLLHNKADPHICNEAFQTALFCAVRKGHVSVVNLLLDAGSDVHAQDIAGNTPLFYAASSGCEEVVRLLLEKGAQIDHRNALQETALFFAARHGRTAVANLLIEAGATPDPRNLIMESPLIYAAGCLVHIPSWPSKRTLDYSSVVTLLLENGADPNPRYNPTFQSKSQFESWEVLWSSPIHRLRMPPRLQNACCEAARHIWKSRVQEYDDEQILIFLERLIYQGSTHFRNLWRKGEATPFLWAVRGRHIDLVARLLRAGVSIKIQNKSRTDIFIEAVESGNTRIAELLLDDLADPSAATSQLWSMVLRAAEKGDIAMMKMLFSKPSISQQVAELALFRAISGGHIDGIRFLLEEGINPHTVGQIDFNAQDEHGRTPLFYAVDRGQLSIAQLLLQRGANPNTTECGQTPLFFAAANGHKRIVKVLLDWGARPDLWAAIQGFGPIVKVLIDKGTNVNCFDDPNQSPLLWALGQGKMTVTRRIPVRRGRGPKVRHAVSVGGMEAVVKLLLHHGADPNTADGHGRGPIHLLVERRYNRKRLVKLLLKAGTDPNKKDKYGRTALMGATVLGQENIVAALLEAPNIDRDATDVFGRTALMEASTRNQPHITKLLSQGRGDDPAWHSFDASDNFGPRGDVICEICRAWTFRESAYHCKVCYGDRFQICEECRRCGAVCLDETHRSA